MESYRIIPNAIPSIVDSTVKTKLIKLKKVADDIHFNHVFSIIQGNLEHTEDAWPWTEVFLKVVY
jgi:hypothetical protein